MEMSQSIHYILPEEHDPLYNKNKINNEHNDEGPSTIRYMSDAVSFFDQAVGRGVQRNSPMPEEAIAKNDAIMVDWFAGWANTQFENFRKFHVIMAPCGGGGPGARGDGSGGGPGPGGAYERLRKEWMRKWGHVRYFLIYSSPPSPPTPARPSLLFFLPLFFPPQHQPSSSLTSSLVCKLIKSFPFPLQEIFFYFLLKPKKKPPKKKNPPALKTIIIPYNSNLTKQLTNPYPLKTFKKTVDNLNPRRSPQYPQNSRCGS